MKKTIKKGLTLIEVMIVITLIGILSSIVVVSVNGARTSSRNKAAYIQITQAQMMAYKCIRSGNSINNNPSSGAGICGVTGNISGYSTWPTLPTGSSWVYGAANVCWCPETSSIAAGSSAPGCGGTTGGIPTTGKFCYKFTNSADSSKSIWCTQDGCASKL